MSLAAQMTFGLVKCMRSGRAYLPDCESELKLYQDKKTGLRAVRISDFPTPEESSRARIATKEELPEEYVKALSAQGDVPAPQSQQAYHQELEAGEEVLKNMVSAGEAGRVIGEALMSSGKLTQRERQRLEGLGGPMVVVLEKDLKEFMSFTTALEAQEEAQYDSTAEPTASMAVEVEPQPKQDVAGAVSSTEIVPMSDRVGDRMPAPKQVPKRPPHCRRISSGRACALYATENWSFPFILISVWMLRAKSAA